MQYTNNFTRNKKLLTCPKCGKKTYYRVDYTDRYGVHNVVDCDDYGYCFSNNNCYSMLMRGKQGTYSFPTTLWLQQNAMKLREYDESEITAQSSDCFTYNDEMVQYVNNGIPIAENNLIKYCEQNNLQMKETIRRYKLGTNKDFQGNDKLNYWYIDYNGNVKNCKQMVYDESGHRVKPSEQHKNVINYCANVISYYVATKQRYTEADGLKKFKKEFEQNQRFKLLLYGEHLLKGNDFPIFVFESEKSAIIMDAYLKHIKKDIVCVAIGGKNNYGHEMMDVLNGRKVYAFADYDTRETIADDVKNAKFPIQSIEWWRSTKSKLTATKEELDELLKSGDHFDFADVVLLRMSREYDNVPFETSESTSRFDGKEYY